MNEPAGGDWSDDLWLLPWRMRYDKPNRLGNEEFFVSNVRIFERWFNVGGNRPMLGMELTMDVQTKYCTNYSEGSHVTLLIPDPNRPQREDFVWCIPVNREKFNKWFKLAEKFKGLVPKEHGGGLRYMHRFDKGKVKTIIVMPTGAQSDDDAQTACAWLRMIKQFDCKIYIVRCSDDPMRGAKLISAAMGADPQYLEEVEEGEERGTGKDGTVLPTEA